MGLETMFYQSYGEMGLEKTFEHSYGELEGMGTMSKTICTRKQKLSGDSAPQLSFVYCVFILYLGIAREVPKIRTQL